MMFIFLNFESVQWICIKNQNYSQHVVKYISCFKKFLKRKIKKLEKNFICAIYLLLHLFPPLFVQVEKCARSLETMVQKLQSKRFDVR